MSTRWQTKRDTAANWTNNDPVLLAGEIGYETDTGKFKFGDGSTAWTSLLYCGATSLSDIIGLAKTDGNFIVGDGTNWVAESGDTARTSLGLGTGNSPTFTNLYTSGSLGVGTGSPTGKFEVYDTTYLTLIGKTVSDTVAVRPMFIGMRARTGPAAVQSGDYLMSFIGQGYDSAAYQSSSMFEIVATENWNAGARGSKIYIYTVANGDTTLSKRITVENDGNIGIGTSAPDGILEVNMGTNKFVRLSYNDADGSATDYSQFTVDADGGLTVTTVDSDGAAGNLTLSPDGTVVCTPGTIFNSYMDMYGAATAYGTHVQYARIEEEVTIPVGSGFDPVVVSSGSLAPAMSTIKFVTARVTQAPGGGATTLDIGRTGGNLDEFADGIGTGLGTTANSVDDGDGTLTGPVYNSAAATLTLTTDADVTDSDMKVRIVVFYEQLTEPTS